MAPRRRCRLGIQEGGDGLRAGEAAAAQQRQQRFGQGIAGRRCLQGARRQWSGQVPALLLEGWQQRHNNRDHAIVRDLLLGRIPPEAMSPSLVSPGASS